MRTKLARIIRNAANVTATLSFKNVHGGGFAHALNSAKRRRARLFCDPDRATLLSFGASFLLLFSESFSALMRSITLARLGAGETVNSYRCSFLFSNVQNRFAIRIVELVRLELVLGTAQQTRSHYSRPARHRYQCREDLPSAYTEAPRSAIKGARESAARDFYPSGRMIACLLPAANFAIDARNGETRGSRRAEQQMVVT